MTTFLEGSIAGLLSLFVLVTIATIYRWLRGG